VIAAGVVSYMLLYWGGVPRDSLVYIFSLIFGTFCSQQGEFSACMVLLCVHRLGAFGFLCASMYLEHIKGMEVWFYPFLTSTLDSGE
jgi:hypothetical protein